MKKSYFRISLSLVILLSIFAMSACSNTKESNNESAEYVVDESDFLDGEELIGEISESPLNQDEIDGLILMREEEKLARDVYLTLGEEWGIKIFSNIAASEQTHTDAVKSLLERYEIADPVDKDDIGVFTSTELSELYDQLVEQGEKSLLDALIVGVTVEDLDISDLNKLTEETDKTDILAVYDNLNRGSRNHLRAFMKQVARNGGDYNPQFISQSEFDDILSSEQEKGKK